MHMGMCCNSAMQVNWLPITMHIARFIRICNARIVRNNQKHDDAHCIQICQQKSFHTQSGKQFNANGHVKRNHIFNVQFRPTPTANTHTPLVEFTRILYAPTVNSPANRLVWENYRVQLLLTEDGTMIGSYDVVSSVVCGLSMWREITRVDVSNKS